MQRPDVCVLIPTFNNAETLSTVIEGVLAHTPRVIVVNDGSTDRTGEILARFPMVSVVAYARNRGKGFALRQGFIKALSLGYRYAITIDSDGQHYPEDLDTFERTLATHEGALIVGARNMENAAQPGGSSFGNRFSNFWFHLETGIRCPDTQSGYRLYPVERLRKVRWWTRKYEFEVEVLVRAAWRKVPVVSVPVRVYYPPPEERVTHFRPLKDFTRISVLNTALVLIMITTFKWIR